MDKLEIKIKVPYILNYRKMLFGWPIDEFFLVFLMPSAVLANISLLLPGFYITFLYILGKVRVKKPSDWFQYVPFRFLRIKYPYLVDPGKKTYLP